MRSLDTARLVPLLAAAVPLIGAAAIAQQSAGTARALDRAVQRLHRELTANLDVWSDHSTWDKAWVARTPHFAVRTTRSYGLALDLARGLETMLAHFQRVLATDFAPPQPLAVFVFPTMADYNAFGNQFGEHHSSFYGSFHAPAHPENPVAVAWNDNATLLRMHVTHSVVHQYLAAAYPGAQRPPWIEEGLAAYFATFWDYAWSLAEYERIKKDGQLLPLDRLLRDPIANYALDTHTRFVQLGMLFDWLLRFREDSRTTRDDEPEPRAPFRDYLQAILQGRDPTKLPFHAIQLDRQRLAADFRAFEFPK
jgi:hypothetical protein